MRAPERATPIGWLKVADVPAPFAPPALPLPASVVTAVPATVIKRSMLLLKSPTTMLSEGSRPRL